MPTALADAIAATNRNKNNRADTDGIETSEERSTVQLQSKTSISILVVSDITRMRCVKIMGNIFSYGSFYRVSKVK